VHKAANGKRASGRRAALRRVLHRVLRGLLPRRREGRALLATAILVALIGGITWGAIERAVPQSTLVSPPPQRLPGVAPEKRVDAPLRHAEEPGLGAASPLVVEIPPAPPPPPQPPTLAALPPNVGEPPDAVPGAQQAEPAEPAWRRNAVAVAREPGRPAIAVVIDDIGPARGNALRAIALPGPLTLALLPYAEGLPELAAKARAAGHELLVHLPMEPLDLRHNYPGPNALLTDLPLPELAARLDWALGRFEGYVGINNHMGSAFSTFEPGLAVVMQALQARGLLFLDSRTIGNSRAEGLALAYGVPAAGRDVFLDNDAEDSAAIWAQLRQVERIALQRGSAIAIGHPHPATLAALAAWLPELAARGFQLVPISALVREDPAAGHVVQVGEGAPPVQ